MRPMTSTFVSKAREAAIMSAIGMVLLFLLTLAIVDDLGLAHDLLVHPAVDRVVLHDAKVVQVLLADAFQQRAHAGLVHLAADEQRVRHQRRDVRGGVAHAEADLQHGF